MRKLCVVLLLTIISLAGCASSPATRSGFLGDYRELAPVGKSDSLIEQPPAADFDLSRYHAVKIDTPVIMMSEHSEEDRKKLSAVFHSALLEQLGGALPIVNEVGFGVLHVRAAIVSAKKANVPINVVTGLLIYPASRGGVAAEAEVLDGGTGKRIAALSWSRRGARFYQMTASYMPLGEARAGLRMFAKRLADLFDEAEVANQAR